MSAIELLSEFKKRWQISEEIALHGNEIRSRQKKFAWLGIRSKSEQNQFHSDLTNTIAQSSIIVNACVVSRKGYLNRYFEKYGENTWEMMKSAFSILLERAAKYASQEKGKVMVYFEQVGKKEDDLLKSCFADLRSTGHPFDQNSSSKYQPLASTDLSKILVGIEGKPKLNPILQLADLCLYPVVRSKGWRREKTTSYCLSSAVTVLSSHRPQQPCRTKPSSAISSTIICSLFPYENRRCCKNCGKKQQTTP